MTRTNPPEGRKMTATEHGAALRRLFDAIPDAWQRGYQDRRDHKRPPIDLFFVRGQLVNIAWIDYRSGWREAARDLHRQPQLELFQ